MKEVDCLFGLLTALAFMGLLFLVVLAGTGPTVGERARLADSLPTHNTQPSGVNWR